MPKIRSQYLWPQMESVRTRLAAARAQEVVATVGELEEELHDLKAFEELLDSVIQGTVEVKLPIQKARLLPVKRVL